jgi:ParB family chromosome partitioning protein
MLPSPEPKPTAVSKRLGRGLAQLLSAPAPLSERMVAVAEPLTPSAAPVGSAEPSSAREHGVSTVAVDRVTPGRFQPRRVFDEASIAGLVESIQQSGVMQPILVRPIPVDPAGKSFEIVAGERRWRAAGQAGLKEIPAIVRELSDLEAAQFAVTENLQREDLNAMEKGWSLRGMVERFGLTQEQVAQRLGVDRSSVANLIRLTDLEPEIAELIASGKLSAGHGKALLAVAAGEARLKAAKEAAAGEWSVRQMEAWVKRRAQQPLVPAAPEEGAAHASVLADLERQLGQYLGTRVHIRTGARKDKGALQIEFYGLDHFDGLLRRMGFDRG